MPISLKESTMLKISLIVEAFAMQLLVLKEVTQSPNVETQGLDGVFNFWCLVTREGGSNHMGAVLP